MPMPQSYLRILDEGNLGLVQQRTITSRTQVIYLFVLYFPKYTGLLSLNVQLMLIIQSQVQEYIHFWKRTKSKNQHFSHLIRSKYLLMSQHGLTLGSYWLEFCHTAIINCKKTQKMNDISNFLIILKVRKRNAHENNLHNMKITALEIENQYHNCNRTSGTPCSIEKIQHFSKRLVCGVLVSMFTYVTCYPKDLCQLFWKFLRIFKGDITLQQSNN